MSIPGNTPEAQGSASSGAPETQTFAEQVNTVAQQLTKDDKGVWQLPDTLKVDESVKFAATLEKRRRDTESALGKTRYKLKTEEGVRKALEKRVADQVELSMTPEEAEVLETLKQDDPDEWRSKVNKLEAEATASLQTEFDALTVTASQQAELARRESVLAEFNALHPDAPITDESLQSDIPPRIVKKLEEGKSSFEEFLLEAHTYLTKPRKVGTKSVDSQPNLGAAGGGSAPSDEATAAQGVANYQNTVF